MVTVTRTKVASTIEKDDDFVPTRTIYPDSCATPPLFVGHGGLCPTPLCTRTVVDLGPRVQTRTTHTTTDDAGVVAGLVVVTILALGLIALAGANIGPTSSCRMEKICVPIIPGFIKSCDTYRVCRWF